MSWKLAQKYKFDDYVFDGTMWVSIMSTKETNPQATKIEVHIGYKNRSKSAVMASYERMRQKFFQTGLKSGKFYYKSNKEYITVNIVDKKEILHPKGKSYYVYFIFETEEPMNVRDLVKAPTLQTISTTSNVYDYITEEKYAAPTPYTITITAKTSIDYVIIKLRNSDFGVNEKINTGDVIIINSATKKFELKKAGRLFKVGYVDGTVQQIAAGKNSFTFSTNIVTPGIELFDVTLNAEERI
jgi:hypothetical protein